jgi:hypothetical protein
MPPKNIRVTAEVWGAGPGMGGTSYIEFKLNGEIYDVFAGGTALDGREKLGEVKLSDGWRGRVSYIVNESPPYHEEKSPDDIVVRGAKGKEAHLLAAAWSGENGAQFVGLVLQFDDVEVEKMIDNSKFDMAGAIATLSYIIAEIDSSEDKIIREIRSSLQSGGVDWDQLKERLAANADAAEAQRQRELEAARSAREHSLRPFQDQISQAVSAWVAVQSKNQPRVDGHQQQGLRQFLEDFVLSQGKFPTGTVSINYSYRGKYGAQFGGFFEVDLDSHT